MKQLMFQDDQQFWFETLRNLGLAVYGGSDVGEVVATASRVTSGDYDGWHDAWLSTAKRLEAEARASHRRSLRQRATTAFANRSRDSSIPRSSTASHSASWAWSSSVHSRKPNAPRISTRFRLIARPAQSYAAHSSSGTFTCWATYDTAGAGISAAVSGNRASTSKNFNNNANPSRFAPDLFRRRSRSSSSSVQTSIRSSGSHS